MTYLENPFPREAVTTYGKQILGNTANLGYVRKITALIDDYLSSFVNPDKRYGGGIGIRGGHGSGKTHLLYMQAKRINEFTNVKASVAYAKADTNSFFDLHRQFMTRITQKRIIELIDVARKNTALEQVRRAHATESLAKRIDSSTDVQTIINEGNLDANVLLSVLEERLQGSEVSRSIPTVLLMVDASPLGRKAYQWLCGDLEPELDIKGIQPSLSQAVDSKDINLATELAAIQTIETITVLHELAGEPLVLLIDQLEVLMRTDISNKPTLFSLFKKLVEQVKAHGGLILIAGNEESWELPRDIGPRMITREPITIGNLTLEETSELLKAYLEDSSECFSQKSVSTIRKLSGGNPREILRIAHNAFDRTNGEIGRIDENLLISSAQDSGSIADRERLALEIFEHTANQYGITRPSYALGENNVIQRLLTINDQPWLGVVTITARDRLEEVNSARLVSKTQDAFRQKWQDAQLLVIAVGYSSQEIRGLLEPQTKVVVFDEHDRFSNELNSFIIEALAQKRSQTGEHAQTEKISEDLDRIENSRVQKQLKAENLYQGNVQNLAEKQMLTEQARTRWGLLEQIDQLEEFLIQRRQKISSIGYSQLLENLLTERNVMRSMLIGNEAGLRNEEFDYVGGVYLDILSLELSNPPPNDKSEFEILDNRLWLVGQMREILRSRNNFPSLFRKNQFSYSIAIGVLVPIFYVFSIFLNYYSFSSTWWDYFVGPFVRQLPLILFSGFMAVFITYVSIQFILMQRQSQWRRILYQSKELLRRSK